jgi:hypothetical protein
MEKDPHRRWDVVTSRGFLRELLAGPLAQNPSPNHSTDPWAVVQAPPAPPPVYAERPSRQVGGRAMLHTGESPAARRPRHSTNAMPVVGTGRTPQQQNKLRLAVAGGVAAALLLATVSWAVFGRDKETPKAQQVPTVAPSTAPANVQQVEWNGITVTAPKDWKTEANSSYFDIESPADGERFVRLNAAASEKDARKTLESAERGTLKTLCADGYQKVALVEADLAGTKGWQLEFLCTPKGKAQKHGIWRIAVIGGKSRHLYLQTWAANFEEDKKVFDAMLPTYKVT